MQFLLHLKQSSMMNCIVRPSLQLKGIVRSENFMKVCCSLNNNRNQSSSSSSNKKDVAKSQAQTAHDKQFVAPSPFKNPGPRRYGYEVKHMTKGTLPRDGKPVRALPEYRATDSWDNKSATFGQNDYIDILGDGDVHPSDLLTGPAWLLGFKGNERERLMRKMEWQGHRTRILYPEEYKRMEKRIRYLTKIYNTKRHTRSRD